MKAKHKLSLLTGSLLLASGCAFKMPVESKSVPIIPVESAPAQNEAPVAAVVKKQGLVTVSWLEPDTTPSPQFKRELSAPTEISPLVSQIPLVVSRGVPDELSVTVSSSVLQGKDVKRVEVLGRMSAEGGIPFEMTVSELGAVNDPKNEKLSSWKMNVGGLGKLLSSGEESAAYLSVRLFVEGSTEPVETAEMPVMTPPSKIAVSQKTVSEYETKTKPLPAFLKSYVSTGGQLDLLQVISIKNNSNRSTEIRLPLNLNGSLATHSTRIDLQQEFCSYRTSQSESDDVLSSVLYLLPISDDVAHHFSEFMNKALPLNQMALQLQAGEEKIYGVYAQGEKVRNLLAHGHVSQSFQTVNAPTSCKSVCGYAGGTWNFNPMDKAYVHWQSQGFPGDSRACSQSVTGPGGGSVHSFCTATNPVPQSNPELCNRCAAWELTNGVPASDVNRRFCWGPSGEAWRIEKTCASVVVGVQTAPVYLKLSPQSTGVEARFIFEGITEPSPARNFVNFIQPETIQAQ